MSFADQLKNLKGLMASREQAQAEEARRAQQEEAARQAKEKARADTAKRLLDACATVRSKGLLQPVPDRRIALLILILDALPFEELWREWIRRQDGRTQVTVWIHAKHPERVTSQWVASRLLPTSFRPEWGSVEITRAELELLHAAVEASDATQPQRFLFASESCLPILPLDAAADALFGGEPRSWVNARPTPNNGYSNQQQFDPLLAAGLPRDRIWKADQWVALTRQHAEAVLALPEYLQEEVWPYFKRCSASDEMFFPTCLALLGEITAATPAAGAAATNGAGAGAGAGAGVGEGFASRSVVKRRLTYCRWGDSPKSPESFETLEAGVLAAAVEEGCLFARKFRPAGVELSAWLAHMRGVEAERGGLGVGGREAVYAEDAEFEALTLDMRRTAVAVKGGPVKRHGGWAEEWARKRPRRAEEEEEEEEKERRSSSGAQGLS